MWIIIYLAPASLIAGIVLAFAGNKPAAQIAIIGWLVFTFLGWFAHKRTIPERILAAGNACLFLLAIVYATLIGGRPS